MTQNLMFTPFSHHVAPLLPAFMHGLLTILWSIWTPEVYTKDFDQLDQ